ncbi:MAG TPA: TlyA family RNA methyltransferase [Nitrospinota bacterium]|nr:TlyA family RNA methyltransferase [Nitrospinota bacterium]|tara:strand:+ start:13250 stop:13978 length:729 start_codon:yes stop_codon:yes gene_type:complete
MLKKKRLDQYLVELNLAESRNKAQALIMAGKVTVDKQEAKKAGQVITANSEITVKEGHGFVSRGGVKLSHALDSFKVLSMGKVCLDIGASTGGFTDCLLQRGAAKIWAVDVGYNQLHYKLRTDCRVVCMEKTNARTLDPTKITDPISLLVADVSFISLKLVIPPLLPALLPNADLVVLVKPQFEANKECVSKGVVKDENVRLAVVQDLMFYFRSLGLVTSGVKQSPITGAKGNIETFLWLNN